MSFEINRLRRSGQMVAVGAAALFIFMFFFKWFGINVPGLVGAYINAAGVSTSANAWHSLEVTRLVLLLTVIASVTLVVLVGSGRKLEVPVPVPISAISAIVAGLGALSTVLVFYRTFISHPFVHTSVKVGAYLGLIACAAIAYGGYRAMADEGTSLGDVRDQARASFDSVTAPAGGASSTGGAEAPPESPGEPPAQSPSV